MSEKLAALREKFEAEWDAQMRKLSLQGQVRAGEEKKASDSQKRHADKSQKKIWREIKTKDG